MCAYVRARVYNKMDLVCVCVSVCVCVCVCVCCCVRGLCFRVYYTGVKENIAVTCTSVDNILCLKNIDSEREQCTYVQYGACWSRPAGS